MFRNSAEPAGLFFTDEAGALFTHFRKGERHGVAGFQLGTSIQGNTTHAEILSSYHSFSMPFFLAHGIATGLLAIFEPRMGHKPSSANTTQTLLGVSLTTHGFTPPCSVMTIRSKPILLERIHHDTPWV